MKDSGEEVVRDWCAVDGCDAYVTCWSQRTCEDMKGAPIEAMVPFCREHGPKAGGAV